MSYILVKKEPLIFSGLSDAKTPIFSADNTTIIHHIIICNRTANEIRVNLEIVDPLKNPISRGFISNFIRIKKYGSKDLCVLKNNVDDEDNKVGEKIELPLTDACNLICFSNDYKQVFDCTVVFSEMQEKDDLI